MQRNLVFMIAAILVATSASSAFAHSDVLVRDVNGKTAIGSAEDLDGEEGGPFFELGTTAFEGIFLNPAVPTPPFGFDFERDEPGFYSDPSVPVGGNLPANADLNLEIEAFAQPSGVDTTFYWDGAGAVNFNPLATAQPGVSFTWSPEVFATTDASGFVDDHPLFGLTGGAADGVYLTRHRLQVDGLAKSDPFYMVWLASSTLNTEALAEELEEALEAFEDGGPAPVVGGVDYSFYEEAVEYAEGIPEPSSALLLTLALAAAGAATRR